MYELPSSLDQLATYGVINFDAESYIKGKAPRYVGAPNGNPGLPFDQPIGAPGVYQGAQLSGQPHKDEFVNKEGEQEQESKNPSWKKVLAGVVAAGAATFLGVKYGPKIASKFKKAPVPAPTASTATTAAVVPPVSPPPAAKVSKIKNAFSKIKRGVSKVFTKTKDLAKKIWPKFKALPKGVQIGAYIAGGLTVLYGVYKVFSGGKHASAEGYGNPMMRMPGGLAEHGAVESQQNPEAPAEHGLAEQQPAAQKPVA